MTITMTREALLKTLNERLAAAKAEDELAMKVHTQDEEKALAAWKVKVKTTCDRLLKMTYQEARSTYRSMPELERPKCPQSEVWKIKDAITAIKLDMRKSELYQINDASDLYEALTWLPPSKRPAKSLCPA